MVYSNQQWCLMRWNQTTSVGSLGLMSTVPNIRPFFGMSVTFARLIAQLFKNDLHSELARLDHPSIEQYNIALQLILDKHAPVFKRKVSVGKNCPWFSLVGDELLAAKRQRRQAEREWRSTGLTIHKELYSKAYHRLTKLAQKAASVLYDTNIAASASSKELYSITNKLQD